MKKIFKFIPFILLITYYLLIFNSQLSSNAKLFIAFIIVIISFLSFMFINKEKMEKKKIIPLIISLTLSTIITIYFL